MQSPASDAPEAVENKVLACEKCGGTSLFLGYDSSDYEPGSFRLSCLHCAHRVTRIPGRSVYDWMDEALRAEPSASERARIRLSVSTGYLPAAYLLWCNVRRTDIDYMQRSQNELRVRLDHSVSPPLFIVEGRAYS